MLPQFCHLAPAQDANLTTNLELKGNMLHMNNTKLYERMHHCSSVRHSLNYSWLWKSACLKVQCVTGAVQRAA